MTMDVPMTMDLSPSQLNQTNVDANGNSLPQVHFLAFVLLQFSFSFSVCLIQISTLRVSHHNILYIQLCKIF
jgi:hypothetical protein